MILNESFHDLLSALHFTKHLPLKVRVTKRKTTFVMRTGPHSVELVGIAWLINILLMPSLVSSPDIYSYQPRDQTVESVIKKRLNANLNLLTHSLSNLPTSKQRNLPHSEKLVMYS